MPPPGHPAIAPLRVELRLLSARGGPEATARLNLRAGANRDLAQGLASSGTGMRPTPTSDSEIRERANEEGR